MVHHKVLMQIAVARAPSFASGHSGACGLQKSTGLAVEYKAGQDIAAVGTGIDADAVMPDIRLIADAVPVYHHGAMVGIRVEEGLADPQAVACALFLQRHAGPYATMDEKIVPCAVADPQAAEEIQM